MHIKRIDLYKKCCRILGVEDTADQNTIRKAYIELIKKVHPDSGLPEASEESFREADEAFKLLQQKFAKSRRDICEDEQEEVPDIRHTVPQHRQYLSFDGIGAGNPFQREKQYQQIKAMKAQERVLNHRIDKSQAGEKTIMKKDSFFKNHAIKTKYGLDRLVEDYIQEAISKGDFSKLKGAGKPLTQTQQQNPYLDFTTHKLNKILIDNGFTPEWITLQCDIRKALRKLKNKLVEERTYFGDYPLTEIELQKWQNFLQIYEYEIKQINKNIDKYNLIVPILEKQFFRVNLQAISEKILQDPDIPKNRRRTQQTAKPSSSSTPHLKNNLLSFLGSWF